MSGKILTVFGATGFIGRELLRSLEKEKRDLFSVVRIVSRKNKDVSFLQNLKLNVSVRRRLEPDLKTLVDRYNIYKVP